MKDHTSPIRKEDLDLIDRDIPEQFIKYPEYLRESLRGKSLIVCLLCKKASWILRTVMLTKTGTYYPCSNSKHKSIIIASEDLSEERHIDIVCNILQKSKEGQEEIPEIGRI